VQLGSNVTDYTIVLELYNFTNNNTNMNAIGPKLNAIFALGVTSFVGCHHKSDYTLLRRQYPLFHLPTEGVIEKMSDVGVMDLNRGLVKKTSRNHYTTSTV